MTLTFAQGVLVRRMAGRVSEGTHGKRRRGARHGRLFAAAVRHRLGRPPLDADRPGVIVVGFAFMMPSLNSLISRRSDPAQQGGCSASRKASARWPEFSDR